MASWSLGDLEWSGRANPIGRAIDNYSIGRETGLASQDLPAFEKPRPLDITPAPSVDDDSAHMLYAARHEQAVKDIAEMAKRREVEEQQAAEEAAIRQEGAALADRIANRFAF